MKLVRILAFLGSAWGLICAFGLSGIRFANSSEPERDVATTAAFALVYAAPFMLALVALFWKSAVQRAAIWLAAGVLAFLASWTAFSGISLIFLPAAPLLLLAAAISMAQAIRTCGVRPALPFLPVSLGLIGVGIAAFVALITLTSDPRCWALVHYADGHEEWQIAPPGVASITAIAAPNGQQGLGSGMLPPPGTVPGIIASRCASDIISPVESAVSLSLWIFAGVALMGFRRYWDTSPVHGEVVKG